MKLVTFQSMDAFKELVDKGYLETNKSFIDIEKMGPTYAWVLEKMNEQVPSKYNAPYPLWCWVKFKNGICPPKHKGIPVKGFDVKITFHKSKEDVFITDFRRYSFVLNNMYIPDDSHDKEIFEQKLKKYGITTEELKAVVRPDKFSEHRTDQEFLDVCSKIRKSFDKCINEDSDVLQGCIWRIYLEEVEKVEFLTDTEYTYGSFNYVRNNGKRFDWIEDFYRRLKE